MSEPTRTVGERGCPRVIGASDDGKRLLTCGRTRPCPTHDAPRPLDATPAMAMVIAALVPTAQWRLINGHSCWVLDVTPHPNRTHKTFHRIQRVDAGEAAASR